jgi:Cu/Ag efflux pump CusA
MRTKSIRSLIVLLLVCVLAVGVLAAVGVYLFLPRGGQELPRPKVGPPVTLAVVAEYPGASAEEVERLVTIPLELTFAGTPGLRFTRSQSTFGFAHLRLEFDSRIERLRAREEIINRLSTISQPLPEGVSPTLDRALPKDAILRYTLASPRDQRAKAIYTPTDLRALQDWVVERQFRSVHGVHDVEGSGGAVSRFEVHVDPDRLRRYGITLRQLQSALDHINATVGGDYVAQGGVGLTVRRVGLFGRGKDPVLGVLELKEPREAAGRLRAAEARRIREIRSQVIANVNGAPVRLEDLVQGGRLGRGEKVTDQGVVVGRRPGQVRVVWSRPGQPDEDDLVQGIVFMHPGENLQAALDRVKARIRELNDTPGRLLPGVKIQPFWERGDTGQDELLILRAGFQDDISREGMTKRMRQARAILVRYPEVRAVLSQFGSNDTGFGPFGPQSGEVLALLHPDKVPPGRRRELIGEVRAKLTRALPGTDLDVLLADMDDFQAAFVAAPGEGLLKISGPDVARLERLAEKAQAELWQLAGVEYIHIRHVVGKTNLVFRVDPKKCARWGVSPADVNNIIAAALDGERATPMNEGEKELKLRLIWPQSRRRTLESILDIPADIVNNTVVPSQGPSMIPSPFGTGVVLPATRGPMADTSKPISNTPRLRLRDLVTPVGDDGELDPNAPFVRLGFVAIWREQGRRLIAVRFSIRGRDEADVLAEARTRLSPLIRTPYSAEWSGACQ